MADYGKSTVDSWYLDLGDSNGRFKFLRLFLKIFELNDRDEYSYTESTKFRYIGSYRFGIDLNSDLELEIFIQVSMIYRN